MWFKYTEIGFLEKKILAGENFLTSWCNPAKYEIDVLKGYKQNYIKYTLIQNIFVKTDINNYAFFIRFNLNLQSKHIAWVRKVESMI